MKYTFPTLAADSDRTYVVMGPGVWGKGLTVADALKAAQKNGPTPRYVVFNAPRDARVDEMGLIRWTDGEQLLHEVVRVGDFDAPKATPRPDPGIRKAARAFARSRRVED